MQAEGTPVRKYSKTKNFLWVLLGIFIGSWFGGNGDNLPDQENSVEIVAAQEEAIQETDDAPEPVNDPVPTEEELAAQNAAQEAEELAKCREDLQCWGDKHSLRATMACEPLIEAQAQYDYEWADGWMDAKFDRFGWKDKPNGVLAYRGDKIKFQNGFGAWQHMTYWCAYDPDTKSANPISIQPR